MYPKEIPNFIEQVMEQIEIGIDRVAQKKLVVVEPPSGVDPPMVHVQYPEHVEMMLNVEALLDDESGAEEYEHQTIWVKIPWPTRIA